MLNENKFSKYLIYAIGEIVLVVIGILIALQINNWNENKKNINKEIFHLENVLGNLRDDLNNQITPCIERTEKQISAYDLLQINFYEKDDISNDSVRRLFFQNLHQWDLVLNIVAFDNLKSTEMDIISNDSIKSKLLTLYGNNYKYVEQLQTKNNKFHYDGVTTLIHDNSDLWDGISNEEKEFLKNDIRLTSRMKTEIYGFQNFLEELYTIKPKVVDLIEGIEGEIHRLKSK